MNSNQGVRFDRSCSGLGLSYPANCEHVRSLREDGFVVVDRFLPEDILTNLDHACTDLKRRWPGITEPDQSERHPPGWTEVPGLIESLRLVEQLSLHPLARFLAGEILGPDFELASAGELDIKGAEESQAHCGWHTDFIWIPKLPYPRQVFWLACYYFLSDIDESSGPLTVMPRSHRFDHPPDASANDEIGRGKVLPGARTLTGRAGTAVFFNNEIWHMSPANRSDRPRRMIKLHYKPSWMKSWGGGRAVSQDYRRRQTDPVLQQLCGQSEYDDVDWQYGTDAGTERYPAFLPACGEDDLIDWETRFRTEAAAFPPYPSRATGDHATDHR